MSNRIDDKKLIKALQTKDDSTIFGLEHGTVIDTNQISEDSIYRQEMFGDGKLVFNSEDKKSGIMFAGEYSEKGELRNYVAYYAEKTKDGKYNILQANTRISSDGNNSIYKTNNTFRSSMLSVRKNSSGLGLNFQNSIEGNLQESINYFKKTEGKVRYISKSARNLFPTTTFREQNIFLKDKLAEEHKINVLKNSISLGSMESTEYEFGDIMRNQNISLTESEFDRATLNVGDLITSTDPNNNKIRAMKYTKNINEQTIKTNLLEQFEKNTLGTLDRISSLYTKGNIHSKKEIIDIISRDYSADYLNSHEYIKTELKSLGENINKNDIDGILNKFTKITERNYKELKSGVENQINNFFTKLNINPESYTKKNYVVNKIAKGYNETEMVMNAVRDIQNRPVSVSLFDIQNKVSNIGSSEYETKTLIIKQLSKGAQVKQNAMGSKEAATLINGIGNAEQLEGFINSASMFFRNRMYTDENGKAIINMPMTVVENDTAYTSSIRLKIKPGVGNIKRFSNASLILKGKSLSSNTSEKLNTILSNFTRSDNSSKKIHNELYNLYRSVGETEKGALAEHIIARTGSAYLSMVGGESQLRRGEHMTFGQSLIQPGAYNKIDARMKQQLNIANEPVISKSGEKLSLVAQRARRVMNKYGVASEILNPDILTFVQGEVYDKINKMNSPESYKKNMIERQKSNLHVRTLEVFGDNAPFGESSIVSKAVYNTSVGGKNRVVSASIADLQEQGINVDELLNSKLSSSKVYSAYDKDGRIRISKNKIINEKLNDIFNFKIKNEAIFHEGAIVSDGKNISISFTDISRDKMISMGGGKSTATTVADSILYNGKRIGIVQNSGTISKQKFSKLFYNFISTSLINIQETNPNLVNEFINKNQKIFNRMGFNASVNSNGEFRIVDLSTYDDLHMKYENASAIDKPAILEEINKKYSSLTDNYVALQEKRIAEQLDGKNYSADELIQSLNKSYRNTAAGLPKIIDRRATFTIDGVVYKNQKVMNFVTTINQGSSAISNPTERAFKITPLSQVILGEKGMIETTRVFDNLMKESITDNYKKVMFSHEVSDIVANFADKFSGESNDITTELSKALDRANVNHYKFNIDSIQENDIIHSYEDERRFLTKENLKDSEFFKGMSPSMKKEIFKESGRKGIGILLESKTMSDIANDLSKSIKVATESGEANSILKNIISYDLNNVRSIEMLQEQTKKLESILTRSANVARDNMLTIKTKESIMKYTSLNKVAGLFKQLNLASKESLIKTKAIMNIIKNGVMVDFSMLDNVFVDNQGNIIGNKTLKHIKRTSEMILHYKDSRDSKTFAEDLISANLKEKKSLVKDAITSFRTNKNNSKIDVILSVLDSKFGDMKNSLEIKKASLAVAKINTEHYANQVDQNALQREIDDIEGTLNSTRNSLVRANQTAKALSMKNMELAKVISASNEIMSTTVSRFLDNHISHTAINENDGMLEIAHEIKESALFTPTQGDNVLDYIVDRSKKSTTKVSRAKLYDEFNESFGSSTVERTFGKKDEFINTKHTEALAEKIRELKYHAFLDKNTLTDNERFGKEINHFFGILARHPMQGIGNMQGSLMHIIDFNKINTIENGILQKIENSLYLGGQTNNAKMLVIGKQFEHAMRLDFDGDKIYAILSNDIKIQKEAAIDFRIMNGYSEDEVFKIGGISRKEIKRRIGLKNELEKVYKSRVNKELSGLSANYLDYLAGEHGNMTQEEISEMKKVFALKNYHVDSELIEKYKDFTGIIKVGETHRTITEYRTIANAMLSYDPSGALTNKETKSAMHYILGDLIDINKDTSSEIKRIVTNLLDNEDGIKTNGMASIIWDELIQEGGIGSKKGTSGATMFEMVDEYLKNIITGVESNKTHEVFEDNTKSIREIIDIKKEVDSGDLTNLVNDFRDYKNNPNNFSDFKSSFFDLIENLSDMNSMNINSNETLESNIRRVSALSSQGAALAIHNMLLDSQAVANKTPLREINSRKRSNVLSNMAEKLDFSHGWFTKSGTKEIMSAKQLYNTLKDINNGTYSEEDTAFKAAVRSVDSFITDVKTSLMTATKSEEYMIKSLRKEMRLLGDEYKKLGHDFTSNIEDNISSSKTYDDLIGNFNRTLQDKGINVELKSTIQQTSSTKPVNAQEVGKTSNESEGLLKFLGNKLLKYKNYAIGGALILGTISLYRTLSSPQIETNMKDEEYRNGNVGRSLETNTEIRVNKKYY